jgi:hypothetical protein
MCDYSLNSVTSRAAEAADILIVSTFAGTSTLGFASPDAPSVAVCLRPGTEVAFEQEACKEGSFQRKLGARVARFRQVDLDNPTTHHDALEFPDGNIVKLNELVIGQHVRIVQLPAEPKSEKPETQVQNDMDADIPASVA